MGEILYKKQGKRYVPVAERDSLYWDSIPEGIHLVITKPSSKSIRFNINPDYAGILAVVHDAREAMVKAVVKASEFKPPRPLTEEQQGVWKTLKDKLNINVLNGASAFDIVEAGINVLLDKVDAEIERLRTERERWR